jgi:hypothetical protein
MRAPADCSSGVQRDVDFGCQSGLYSVAHAHLLPYRRRIRMIPVHADRGQRDTS